MQLGPVMALLSGPTVGDAIADPNNAIAKLAKESADDRQLVESLFFRILNRPPSEAEIGASLQVFTDAIDQDQATLQAALENHLKERDPELPAAEKKREDDIAAARTAATEFEAEIKPRVDAEEQARKDRVAKLEADQKAYNEALPAKLAEWEGQVAGDQGSIWTALSPEDLHSTNGATLTREADNSIIASGPNGKTDYTLTALTDLTGITAVRLEMLADDRVEGKGPGRGGGNFVLGEIELDISPAADASNPTRVQFSSAQADFSQGSYEVAKAIDGQPGGRTQAGRSRPSRARTIPPSLRWRSRSATKAARA